MAVNVLELVDLSYRFYKACPTDRILSPKYSHLKPYKPLTRGAYPLFNKYPEFVVNYKQQMREKIMKEEEEYMRQRKIHYDMTKLQDELRRDRKVWGMLDWTVDDVLDRWWGNMQADHEKLLQKKATVHSKVTQDKISAMKNVAEARKAFIETQLQNTLNHISTVTKTMEANRRQFDSELKQEAMDQELYRLQSEWEERKNELTATRKEIEVREKQRLERLLRNVNVIGMKKHELETELDNLDLNV